MKVILSDLSKRQLSKLDKYIAKKIIRYLYSIAASENPRSRGRALGANLSGLWRYRVEDYRLICEIKDEVMQILVIKIGHRKDVYLN